MYTGVENKNYQKELKKQLKEFYNTDHSLDYKSINDVGDKVLIRVFTFVPKDEKNVILLDKMADVRFYKNKFNLPFVPLPIGKVIIGNDKYESGELYQLHPRIQGYSTTTRGLGVESKVAKNSNMELINDPNIQKVVFNVEKEWARYRFQHPMHFNPTQDDLMTYLVPPSIELIVKLDFNDLMKYEIK